MKGLIRFQPIYQTRVWGGRDLAAKLGRSLPSDDPYGESWEVVDRPEAQSVVSEGELAGTSLRTLLEEQGDAVMGVGYPAGRPFPILVKWLDCQDRLSLQVHPPATVAPTLGGEPKTENWYVADCTATAALLVGLKPGASREKFEAALANSTAEELIPRVKVQPHDSLLVESGRIHAIDAGNLILEIQQNSDTTYRVYDWGRVGLDGNPRQLHVEESMQSIDFEDVEPEVLHTEGTSGVIAECKEFRIRKWEIASRVEVDLGALDKAVLLHIAAGTVEVFQDASAAGTCTKGETALLPWGNQTRCVAGADGAIFLVTDRFW